jgi:hypothetical protein
MTFGLATSGFLPKRLLDIKTELESEFQSRFGIVDTSPSSVNGQIIGVMSKVLADVWDQLEHIYYSHYRASANGFSLDNVVQYLGLTRLPSTRTTVKVGLRGVNGSIIPTGTQASAQLSGKVFTQISEVTISNADLLKCKVTVSGTSSGAKVVTINTHYVSYTSPGGQTAAQIAAQLVSLINADISINSDILATDLLNGSFTLITKHLDVNYTSFECIVDSNMLLSELWTPADYSAVDTGAIPAPIGEVSVIVTPKSGLDEVYNFIAGQVGRGPETDAELRIRAEQSTQVRGAGTVEAIRSRLQQGIEEALNVLVFENASDTTVDGRPPHSFEAVVDIEDSTPLKQEVANLLWLIKPAGIQSFGNVSKSVVDSQGYTHTIYFSRPTRVPIYVIVNYNRYDEESFPIDGESTMEAKIIEVGNSLGIGKDVIPQRFFGDIFSSVPGIKYLQILVGTTNPPTSDSPLTISATQVAQFSAVNITINDTTP